MTPQSVLDALADAETLHRDCEHGRVNVYDRTSKTRKKAGGEWEFTVRLRRRWASKTRVYSECAAEVWHLPQDCPEAAKGRANALREDSK